MTDRETLMYRVAHALDHSRTAAESQQAADEGAGTPENAAKYHWDAADKLQAVANELLREHDAHTFAAKRMEQEARKEKATANYEYRGPSAA